MSVKSCKNLYVNTIFVFFKENLCKGAAKYCLNFVCVLLVKIRMFSDFFSFFSNFLSIYLYLGISVPCLPNGCRE